jgi:hypothetical protein
MHPLAILCPESCGLVLPLSTPEVLVLVDQKVKQQKNAVVQWANDY